MKILIIGGVAGGASAAARMRRLNEQAEIILFERGEHISFANCGLPYYIGGVIEKRKKLFVTSKKKMENRFNIDVRNLSEVIGIDRDKKEVSVKNLETNEIYTESYDKLILSPGAQPILPRFEGIEDAPVFTLRNIPDTDKIYDYIAVNKIKSAVVIGGGFIGIEMAENLTDRGIKVDLVDMQNQVMAPFDFEMAQFLHKELIDNKVNIHLEESVSRFDGNTVITNKRQIETELIILAIGVRGETKLAVDAGLEVNRNIVVNEQLQTSDPDIYAIGDAIEVKHYVSQASTIIPLAWPANRQGRIVADHISGKEISYLGTLGTSVAKVFELTAASTGLNEKALMNTGIDYGVIYVKKNNHAGYYPNPREIDLKVIYNKKDELILGAQAIGYEGTEKRIDVIATAIRFGAKVSELAEIEVAYAPPFNSAKDLVNIAGYIGDNQLNGYEFFMWNDVEELIKNKEFILDVRTKGEFEQGSVPTSINIPIDELRGRIDEVPKDKTIYVYCEVGQRAHIAASMLMSHDYRVLNLAGGYNIYKQSNYKW
ncbi:FAD-dependent oxidoreductase [Mycoplasmatota bacterium]|nr:FAD-dependent oxidoreductase [Mycoplasmatota bacterium]